MFQEMHFAAWLEDSKCLREHCGWIACGAKDECAQHMVGRVICERQRLAWRQHDINAFANIMGFDRKPCGHKPVRFNHRHVSIFTKVPEVHPSASTNIDDEPTQWCDEVVSQASKFANFSLGQHSVVHRGEAATPGSAIRRVESAGTHLSLHATGLKPYQGSLCTGTVVVVVGGIVPPLVVVVVVGGTVVGVATTGGGGV